MDSQPTSLAGIVRTELINLDGVTKFSPNRRFATVYSEGGPSDTLYFLAGPSGEQHGLYGSITSG